MNRLLLDQGLPRSAVRHLEECGFDVRHVADIGHSRAIDAEITALALDQGRTIVTLDSDFHRLLAISGASAPSVIRIRREGLRGSDVAALIGQVLERLGRYGESGALRAPRYWAILINASGLTNRSGLRNRKRR